MITSSPVLLKTRYVLEEKKVVVEKDKKHTFCVQFLFSKIVPFVE